MARTPFQSALTRAQKKKPAKAAPPLPPLGSYDPSLLLQYGANKRTAEQAQQSYDLGQSQAQDDTAIQLGRVNQQTGNSLSDLATSHDRFSADSMTNQQRNLADLLSGRQRLTEDHSTALSNLSHRYGIMANQQGQAARQAHVESAGILAQSAAKRAANQALDQQPIDTAFSRGLADSTTAEGRLGQDFATNTSRESQDYQTNTGRVQQGAQNQQADLALALARAYGSGKNGNPLGSNTLNLTQNLSNALSGNLDLSGVAYQQAAANGYRFPSKKKRRTQIV